MLTLYRGNIHLFISRIMFNLVYNPNCLYFANYNTSLLHISLIRSYKIEPSFEESRPSSRTGLTTLGMRPACLAHTWVVRASPSRLGQPCKPIKDPSSTLHGLALCVFFAFSALSSALGDILATQAKGPKGNVPSFGRFFWTLSFLTHPPNRSGMTWLL